MALFRKVGWAMKGIKSTFKSELNFKLEILGGLFLIVFSVLVWPLKLVEFFALIMAYSFSPILELVNTSIEAALARLHPEKHDLIGKAKDAAAGAVFLSVVLTVIVAMIILLNRLGIEFFI